MGFFRKAFSLDNDPYLIQEVKYAIYRNELDFAPHNEKAIKLSKYFKSSFLRLWAVY